MKTVKKLVGFSMKTGENFLYWNVIDKYKAVRKNHILAKLYILLILLLTFLVYNQRIFSQDNNENIFETEDRTILNLIEDLNLSTNIPVGFVKLNNYSYFTYINQSNKFQLRQSDGTPNQTVLIKEFNTGIPNSIIVNNGYLFFAADDGSGNGTELWISDGILSKYGTPNGTLLLKDIRSGSASSYPKDFFVFAGKVFFTADDGGGRQLWKTDGTANGTVKVATIAAYTGSADPLLTSFSIIGTNTFFVANEGQSGRELWKLNTSGAASKIYDLDGTANDMWWGGQTYLLNGITDYARTYSSNLINLSNQSFSWEFWACRNSKAGGFIITQGTKTQHHCLNIGFWDDNTFTFSFWSNDLNYDDGNCWQDGWHHWAGTYDANTKTRTLYLDGEVVKSDVAAANYQGTGDIFIGVREDDLYFCGMIDEVRIWKTTRTAQQILDNFNKRIMTSDANLIGYWRFDRISDLGVNSDGFDDIQDLSSTGANLDLSRHINLLPLMDLRNIDGTAYFAMDDNKIGVGPWKSDGTQEGTVPIVKAGDSAFVGANKVFAFTSKDATPPSGNIFSAPAGHDSDFDKLTNSADTKLNFADSAASDPEGNLYVNQVDSDGSRVIKKFDPNTGGYVSTPIKSPAQGAAGYFSDGGLGFDTSGNLYISSGNSILHYDKTTGQYLGTYATMSSTHDFRGFAFSPIDNSLYVCDRYDRQVYRFNGTTWDNNISYEIPEWKSQDIGATGVAGDIKYDHRKIIMTASGDDIYNKADAFHYLFTRLDGNIEITACVNFINYTQSYAKAGVMIRETLDPDSPQAMMVILPISNIVSMQYRYTKGNDTTWQYKENQARPLWVKLKRTGSLFQGYYSADGKNWTFGWQTNISMATSVYAGLALTSHDNTKLATAQFSETSINGNIHPLLKNDVPIPQDIVFSPTGELFITGYDGDGLKFNGVNNYVTVGSNSRMIISGDLTIETWIKLNHLSSDQRIVHEGKHLYGLQIKAGGIIQVFHNTGSGDVVHNFNTALYKDKWYHLALTRQAANNTYYLYLNGTLMETWTYTGTVSLDGTGSLTIGCREDHAGYFFAGILRDLRIWNCVRSQNDIKVNMNRYLVGTESSLMGYWRMDEGSGTIINDGTQTGNKGTFANAQNWAVKGEVCQVDVSSGLVYPYFSQELKRPLGITANPDIHRDRFYISDLDMGIFSYDWSAKQLISSDFIPFSNVLSPDVASNGAAFGNVKLFTSSTMAQNFTFEGWFYFFDYTHQNLFQFFEWSQSLKNLYLNFYYYYYWATLNTDGTIQFFGNKSNWGEECNMKSTEKIPTHQWVHLAFVFANNNSLSIYKNGVLLGTAQTYNSPGLSDLYNSQKLTIGAGLEINLLTGKYSIHNPVNGYVDEFRYWSAALSSQQIIDLSKDVITPPISNLRGYWRFDQAEALGIADDGNGDVRDLSGNGLHLGLKGQAKISPPNDLTGIPIERPSDILVLQMTSFPKYPDSFVGLNGNIYYAGSSHLFGKELWISVPTTANFQTSLFRDIYPGTYSSSPKGLTIMNNNIYFGAEDQMLGCEIWKSNGSTDGTFLIKDINIGPAGSDPKDFVGSEDTVYFTAKDSVNGEEKWVTDGTSDGTLLFGDVNDGEQGSYPQDFILLGDMPWFTADDGVHGREVWTSGTLKYTPEKLLTFNKGVMSGEKFGQSLSGIGDINNDGYEDFIIAAPMSGLSNRPNCGNVKIFFGNKKGPFTVGLGDEEVLDLTRSVTILGAQPEDHAGISVSGAGDFNGDGYADFMIGVSHSDSQNKTQNQGDIYLFFGTSDFAEKGLIDLRDFSSKDGVHIVGFPNDFNFTGCSVSGIGNINGDMFGSTNKGLDDIIIGAWGAGTNDSGEAYIVFGDDSPLSEIKLDEMSAGEGIRIIGLSTDQKNLGSSVSGVGDVNGDGYPDFIIAADAHAAGDTNLDAPIYLIYGVKDSSGNPGTYPSIINLSQPPPSGINWVKFTGVKANPLDKEHSGTSISGVGDFNKDSFADFLIGAPGADADGINNSGEAYLVFGSSTILGKDGVLNLSQLNVNYDMNGDGRRDGLIIRGPSSTPSVGLKFSNAYLGFSVSGAGDLNGDANFDIIIGAPGLDVQEVGEQTRHYPDAGAAFIVFGRKDDHLPSDVKNSGILRLCDHSNLFITRILGDTTDQMLGWCVSHAGDVNDDGFSDVLIGAPSPYSDNDPGEALLIFGEKYLSGGTFFNYVKTGVADNYNNVNVAQEGIGMILDGSHSIPISGVSIFYKGGKGGISTNPAGRQSCFIYREPVVQPVDDNWHPAKVYWNINITRENYLATKAQSTMIFHYLDNEIAGLNPDRLVLCQTKDDPPKPDTCWVQLPTTKNTINKTFTVNREHSERKMASDLRGYYTLFQIDDTYTLGEEIKPPCNIDINQLRASGPNIEYTKLSSTTLPISGNQEVPVALWHFGTKKLYATAPASYVRISWIDSNNNLLGVQVLKFDWPSEDKFQTFVNGTPDIDLTENNRFKSAVWRVSEDTLILNEQKIGQNKFNITSGTGRCFMVFTTGNNMYQDPIYFLPIRVISWNETPYFLDNQKAIIGEEIMDTNLHDSSLGAPYVFFWENAYYNSDENYYTISTDAESSGPMRVGPIFAVNEDLNLTSTTYKDDMVIVYYQKTPHLVEAYSQKTVSSNMGWSYKPVRYDCKWPSNPPKIVIASTNGTGSLADLNNPAVYYQNDSTTHGYNPNEEHAILLGDTVYAIRQDLNITQKVNNLNKSSLPYVLIKYQDKVDGKYKMRVYKVEAEDDTYKFKYSGNAGTLIQAPMPLSILLPTVNYCPNTSKNLNTPNGCYDATSLVVTNANERAVVYKDKNNQSWASAARPDGTMGKIVMRYFYPVEEGFYFPSKTTQPALGSVVPWLDEYAKSPGIPVNIEYDVDWPSDAPELRFGETLVKPKYGLPDITDQIAVRIIYQQSEFQSTKKDSVKLGNPTKVLSTPLNWATTDIPSDVKWEQQGTKIIFTDLSPILKPRFWFDMDELKLKFKGFFVEPATGESFMLPNVMSTKEHNELINLSPTLKTNNVWKNAISDLKDNAGIRVNVIRRNTDTYFQQHPQEYSNWGEFEHLENNVITIIHDEGNWTYKTYQYKVDESAKIIDEKGNVILVSSLREGYDFVGLSFADVEMIGAPETMTKALSSTGNGIGYITLAFNDHPDCGALPVSLEIIKVSCPLYQGEIKEIEPDCVFDEQLTLRHTGDLSGKTDDYIYEWRTLPDPGTGNAPIDSPDNWNVWDPDPNQTDKDPNTPGKQVSGALDITIKGAGIYTLSDNWFIMRYRKDPAKVSASDPDCANSYSDWTNAMLAPGWIKRVMGKIDPFQQRAVGGGLQTAEDRMMQYQNKTINSIVSMISEAGRRFEGDVALNCDTIDNMGLIEIYETVLRRGISFSIDALPPVDYSPANHALVLCAGRISDLYMMLGNEAFADSLDPTIALGTNSDLGPVVTSIHCFMDQTSDLLSEELALMRGRSAITSSISQVQVQPVYNRLYWNFTQNIVGGQVAYALNYDIRDESGNVDGVINAEDAAILYPQGHGDAWGHYLKAIKVYYELLRHPKYTWTPHAEAVIVGGQPIPVNYMHERKFATVAESKAKTGAEIVELVYREKYTENSQEQWKGYKDSDIDRAWGLYEWAARTGQGAYFDWVVANAIIPSEDNVNEGIQKVDRTTVAELSEIPAIFSEIQTNLYNADIGLNPLGLDKNVIPFDVEPYMMDPTSNFPLHTHFDQIYDRTVASLKNAVTAFNYANAATQELRKQSDSVADFQQTIRDQEFDFNCRLIEIFGTPYPEDMGPGKLYASDYDGPDYIHYMYIDVPSIGSHKDVGNELDVYDVSYDIKKVTDDGDIKKDSVTVTYHFNPDEYKLQKPSNFTRRHAQGEIQMALNDLVRAKYEFDQGCQEYKDHIEKIEKYVDLMEARHDLKNDVLGVKSANFAQKTILTAIITGFKTALTLLEKEGKSIILGIDAEVEGIPKEELFGLASGGDILASLRLFLKDIETLTISGLSATEAKFEITNLWLEFAKEKLEDALELTVEGLKEHYEVYEQMKYELESLILEEGVKRKHLDVLLQAINQAAARYEAALAKGLRLLEERTRFRTKTAAQVNSYRYKDMAFRIFRNDAVQKYRAQLDLASMYSYLAAKVYDYETCFQPGDTRHPGEKFMTGIIKTRSIGIVKDGVPQTAGTSGDPGLADYLARLNANWSVLKTQLGLNNPQQETNQFSLRSELFRKSINSDGDNAWRGILETSYVDNMLNLPEFNQFCISPNSESPTSGSLAQTEPAFVIKFSSHILSRMNYFGFPLAANDSSFDPTKYATKIRSVGVWFSNYANQGLANTPRVYLVPIGTDIMRSPTESTNRLRTFNVVDQALPAPFNLSIGELDSDPSYIPMFDSLNGSLAKIRKYGMLRAYHDAGLNPEQVTYDTRLVARSVWNTDWMLIIPLSTMGSNMDNVKQRFIYGADGKGGVSDIKLFFYTYGYSGIDKKK